MLTDSSGQPPLKWRAFYADGNVYYSESCEWNDLPQLGVVYVVVLHSDGRAQNWTGRDLFWFHDGILANDDDRDGLLRRLPFVKFGQWVTDDEYERICDQARAEVEKFREQLKAFDA